MGSADRLQLALEAARCEACRLHKCRRESVFGEGAFGGRMFIGEAPGYQENRLGRPFVGTAGDVLTKGLEKIGLQREECYITNMVKCRPPNNRNPEMDEIDACRHFLYSEIEIVEPQFIIVMGKVPAVALGMIHSDTTMYKAIKGNYLVKGIDARIVYHPAYIARNRSQFDPWVRELKKCV